MDELLISGVRVWSGGRELDADAVAIKGDRIIAVGRLDHVRSTIRAAEHLRLPGRTVLPGFQDAHVHPPFAGLHRLGLSLHDLGSVDEYRAAITRYAAAHPDVPWIHGAGWSTEVFPGNHPTAALLDDIAPGRPVFLLNYALHEAWVNSAALRRAGITAATPDPPDGRYQRDEHGTPTGALYEGAAYTFQARFLPEPDENAWRAALLHSQAHLHALGVTGWQDAWVTPPILAAYRALEASGELTARVSTALWWERTRGLEQIPGFLDRRGTSPRIRAATVKIMVDGVLENGSGSLLTPYCHDHAQLFDPSRDTGYTYLEPDLLNRAVTELDRLGFQTHLHTIGDRAVRLGLDALEHARNHNGPSRNRHTLAHVQLVDEADLPRFAELNAVANCQTYWAQNDPTMALTAAGLGESRTSRQYPFAGLAAAGATLAMGSDWPVTTADPLWQLEVAVTRKDPSMRDGEPFTPHERLTLDQALTAMTLGSAYVNHDDDAGLVAPGRRADLVVLAGDLLDGAPPADSHVEYTIAAGRIVHHAPVQNGGPPESGTGMGRRSSGSE